MRCLGLGLGLGLLVCCTVSKTDTSKGKHLSQKKKRERERRFKNLKHQQRTMHVSFVFATGAFYIDMGVGRWIGWTVRGL